MRGTNAEREEGREPTALAHKSRRGTAVGRVGWRRGGGGGKAIFRVPAVGVGIGGGWTVVSDVHRLTTERG